MLLNLHEFEIKKEIKKLFEMPNKSLIDLTYFIKNEINDEENINLDINILKNIGSDDINFIISKYKFIIYCLIIHY